MYNRDPKIFYPTILLLQLFLDVAILFNLPVIRQVFSFVFLTFVPGLVILRLLKMKGLNTVLTVLYSAGLSIAILMFLGFLANQLFPILGYLEPLSTENLTIALNIFVIPFCLLGLIWEKQSIFENKHFDLSLRVLPTVLVFTVTPILSVVGTALMNTTGNNLILLLMVAMVPILAGFSILMQRKLNGVFPLSLLSIYLALLLSTWLATNYIVGYDSHFEYYSFKVVYDKGLWNPTRVFLEIDKGSTMLSTTILPTIYAKILNLDPTWVFKIVYPLFAAMVPLGLLQLYQTQYEKEFAFVGAFLFISNALDGLGSLKQWIASLYYVLLFVILFSNNVSSSKQKILDRKSVV